MLTTAAGGSSGDGADARVPPKPENKELVSRSLTMLSRRDLARSEFVAKLLAAGYEKNDVQAAADWCQAQGFLNESRFAEGTARRLAHKYGASRVARSLRDKGVAADAIAEVLPDLQDSDFARAREIWARKFHGPAADAGGRAKQVRFLQARGFTYATIKLVLAGTDGEEA